MHQEFRCTVSKQYHVYTEDTFIYLFIYQFGLLLNTEHFRLLYTSIVFTRYFNSEI